MFVKVVHKSGTYQLYQCYSLQVSAPEQDRLTVDVPEDGRSNKAPAHEILLSDENRQLVQTLVFHEEEGNKQIYFLNDWGKTIDSHMVIW